ncbi:hypothetical protein PUN28_005562 [Cardiocondyla obscurior]|uniref:Uncharacterized protein n=1 Tax=Cardiocondyla obscurior TaxID=286306 RepID=A0AAW2GII2_9HYME
MNLVEWTLFDKYETYDFVAGINDETGEEKKKKEKVQTSFGRLQLTCSVFDVYENCYSRREGVIEISSQIPCLHTPPCVTTFKWIVICKLLWTSYYMLVYNDTCALPQ